MYSSPLFYVQQFSFVFCPAVLFCTASSASSLHYVPSDEKSFLVFCPPELPYTLSSSSPFTASCRAPLYYVQQSSLVLCKVKFFFLFSMSLVTRIRKFNFYTPVLPDCPSKVLFSYVSCNAYSMPCYTYAGFFLVYFFFSFFS